MTDANCPIPEPPELATLAATKGWLARAKAGAVLLDAVIVVQLALSSGYATALDSAVMNRLPVAVAGPPAATARLTAAAGARLDLRPVGSDAEAISQIRDRAVYGALLLGPHRLLVASAAGAPRRTGPRPGLPLVSRHGHRAAAGR